MKIEVAVLLGVVAYVLCYLLARSIYRAMHLRSRRIVITSKRSSMAALNDDALADVLRRLPQQSLAAARCVCKAWRDAVDGRALLHPRFVRGIFINYIDHDRPHLFARPSSPSSTIPRIDDPLLRFIPKKYRDWWSVLDHCNGLLLCHVQWGNKLTVCNPVTQEWTLVPGREGAKRGDSEGAYLVFDPAVSPHYKVILIPAVPKKPPPPHRRKAEEERQALRLEQDKDAPFCLDSPFSSPDDGDTHGKEPDSNDPCRLMKWPPKSWTLQVFSSRTGRWEKRSFVRQGKPAGTVERMRLHPQPHSLFHGPRQWYAVYLQGTLYVHCRGSFVARISFSDDKYQVIKAPANIKYTKPYLGILEGRVCFGLTHKCQLRVWTLDESYGQMEWVVKYENDLMDCAKHVGKYSREMDGAWKVKEKYPRKAANKTAPIESSEWDSDNDDIFEVNREADFYPQHFNILGFHPCKEVVFLAEYFRAVAYHLDSSKLQYLGDARPECYYRGHCNGVYESFVYTPCMIGELDA